MRNQPTRKTRVSLCLGGHTRKATLTDHRLCSHESHYTMNRLLSNVQLFAGKIR